MGLLLVFLTLCACGSSDESSPYMDASMPQIDAGADASTDESQSCDDAVELEQNVNASGGVFFEYKDGKKSLLVPSIDFNHMNLYDMTDYIQGISQFVGKNSCFGQKRIKLLNMAKQIEVFNTLRKNLSRIYKCFFKCSKYKG